MQPPEEEFCVRGGNRNTQRPARDENAAELVECSGGFWHVLEDLGRDDVLYLTVSERQLVGSAVQDVRFRIDAQHTLAEVLAQVCRRLDPGDMEPRSDQRLCEAAVPTPDVDNARTYINTKCH